MLIGQYTHTIDDKGRLAVPSKIRNDLLDGIVLTKGIDGCLWAFPKNEWQSLALKLSSLPLSDANSRAFSRLMLAGAMEVEFDSQGRLLIPGYLREYGAIKKNVIIAGIFNRLEIWDLQKWDDYKSQTEKDTDQITRNLTDLGV